MYFHAALYYSYSTARDNWLNISPVQRDDYGEYVCMARNELGFAEGVFVLEPAGINCNCNFSVVIWLVVVVIVIAVVVGFDRSFALE